MAWWRKQQKAEPDATSAILALTDTEYTLRIADIIEAAEPGTRVQVAVAYQNLLPIVSALHSVNEQRGISFTIEGMLPGLLDSAAKVDEIGSRRFTWFYLAGLVGRLEKVARRTPSTIPMSATVWTILATEYPNMKAALPHNIVWKEDEKEWFDLTLSDGELMQLAVNHHVPPVFAKHPIVERFAKSLGLFYWPSESRVGYIP